MCHLTDHPFSPLVALIERTYHRLFQPPQHRFGWVGWIRTSDVLINSQVQLPTVLQPIRLGGLDSNQRAHRSLLQKELPPNLLQGAELHRRPLAYEASELLSALPCVPCYNIKSKRLQLLFLIMKRFFLSGVRRPFLPKSKPYP